MDRTDREDLLGRREILLGKVDKIDEQLQEGPEPVRNDPLKYLRDLTDPRHLPRIF